MGKNKLLKKITAGIAGLVVIGGIAFVSISPYTERFGSKDNWFYNYSRELTKTEFLRKYNPEGRFRWGFSFDPRKQKSEEESNPFYKLGISFDELEEIVEKYHGSSRWGDLKEFVEEKVDGRR